MKLDKILKYVTLGAVFIVPFVPLVVMSSFFFPYIVGKAFLFRILVEIAVGAWAILAIRNEKYRPKFSWIFVGVLSLVVVMFLADLLGENPLKSFWSNYERMEGWVTLLHLLGYFVVITSFLNTKKLWNRFFNTSLAVSVWVGLYGVFQIAGWVGATQGVSRLDVTFGNASYLAIYAVFHIFLALFLLIQRQSWNDFGGYIYSGIILLNIFILYHTATRGAILGFLGAILLITLLIAVFEKEKKKLRKISIGILVGVILFIGGFIALKNASFIKNSEVLNRFATISLEETTTKSRFMIWSMAWEGVKEKPILGWGQENFSYVFNQNYNPKMYGQEEWFDRTHNVFMDWLIAGGFLGLLAYLSLFVTFLYYLWSRKYNNNFSVFERSIFTGLLVGYFVHNLFVFDNLTSYILFFTILGFIHSQISYSELPEKQEECWLDKISDETIVKIITPIIVILTIFSVYFFNAKSILANRTLLKAIAPQQEGVAENLKYYKKALSYNSFANQEIREQLMQFMIKIRDLNLDPEVKKELLELAVLEAEKEIERDPKNARTEVFLGSLLNRYGYLDEGLKHFKKGLELSPKKQSIMFGMGSAYINNGRHNEGFEILQKAYELEPKYDQAKSLYILSAIYSGNEELVKELFGSIIESGITLDMNFVNAYSKVGDKIKALQVLEVLVRDNPENVQYHVSLAAAYFENGQNAQAMAEIEKAIELDPSFKEQGEKFLEEIMVGKRF